ncbi:hypothetical protein ATO6_21035 [Oceanicola sp. 22II-s10i]|uniref:NAD(P)-dependent oxidoreductase n=1 Tax=Oceanicola sp. 22II-s10i TaxID=1317116 RepID=UPI000B52219F|nr:NAD(P)-dependent oxidoreductase [Oceanicola sp. 22II-s10i]OWU82945.1 hypothetical protein ATO6_21035 [Oceanicola sp. 22II-s10i]
MPNALTIALTAPGMMGAGIGARLVKHGCRVIVPLAERSHASRDRAEKAGMQVAEWEELGQADMILSVVSPEFAESTAEKIASLCAGSKALYADLNAITPGRAVRIGGIVEKAGMRFTDGGIVGPPPPRDEGKEPVIYLSGPAAAEAAGLKVYGLKTELLHGPAGEASALKLSYAGITKGLAALGATMMLAASRAGVEEQLMAELEDSQPQLAKMFKGSIPAMLPKSGRWVSEMHEIAEFIGTDRPEHGIYRAVAELYENIFDSHRADGDEATLLRDLVSK